jgi:hypothetical protein
MIIALVALMAAQAAEPPVQRQEFTAAGPAYPYALRESVARYDACLNPGGSRQYVPGTSVAEAHRVDVARCDPELPAIIASAVDIWRHERGRKKAEAEVADLFAQLRENHVQQGERFDRMIGQSAASHKPQTGE